eukprot:g40149.t1
MTRSKNFHIFVLLASQSSSLYCGKGFHMGICHAKKTAPATVAEIERSGSKIFYTKTTDNSSSPEDYATKTTDNCSAAEAKDDQPIKLHGLPLSKKIKVQTPSRKVLVVLSSPLNDHSMSSAAARLFVDEHRKAYPEDTVEFLDLGEKKLPVYGADSCKVKFALYGGADKAEGLPAWAASKALIEQLMSADKLVLAAPTWNFFVPDVLKQYIDHLAQPNVTFNPANYAGLVTGKPALIIRSAGNAVGHSMDVGLPWLYQALQFIGFQDMQHLAVPMTANVAGREALLKQVGEQAAALAKSFTFDAARPRAELPALVWDAKAVLGTPLEANGLGQKVLLVSASPMGANSASLAAANGFLDSYRTAVPGTEVTTLDLAALAEAGELPPYTASRVQAKFAKFAGKDAKLNATVASEWAYCEARIKELVEANTIVFATPTWNFGLPHTFVRYLAHVVQPHYTFNPVNFSGLLQNKRAFVFAASGGATLGGPRDFVTPWLKSVLGLMGVADIRVSHLPATASGTRASAIENSIKQMTGLLTSGGVERSEAEAKEASKETPVASSSDGSKPELKDGSEAASTTSKADEGFKTVQPELKDGSQATRTANLMYSLSAQVKYCLIYLFQETSFELMLKKKKKSSQLGVAASLSLLVSLMGKPEAVLDTFCSPRTVGCDFSVVLKFGAAYSDDIEPLLPSPFKFGLTSQSESVTKSNRVTVVGLSVPRLYANHPVTVTGVTVSTESRSINNKILPPVAVIGELI